MFYKKYWTLDDLNHWEEQEAEKERIAFEEVQDAFIAVLEELKPEDLAGRKALSDHLYELCWRLQVNDNLLLSKLSPEEVA